VSRFDEIKARCDAATQGPWSFDWSEGEVPVFYGQTTKISGTFSVEANTIEDAEFIAAAREDVPWLIECIGELNGAICWDTTCLNCSSLLDSNYDQYMRAEIAEAEIERLTDLCDEFRKREESQDRIRERLTAEVERLERWKAEATEVMSGLRELGKALGLGLGVQITGPAALAEVARLTAEREWFNDRFPCDGVCVDAPEEACSRHGRNPADLWQIIGEVAAERNALAAAHARESEKVWKVEEVMDDIEGSDPTTWERLRAALAGSEADTSGAQTTDPGCGCSTNPARARYADGDPAGCYCTCSDDAREGCEHEPDEPQPTDLEVK